MDVTYEGEGIVGRAGNIKLRHGKMTYLDGDLVDCRYEGEFLEGRVQGQGKWYRPADGTPDGILEYEGEWQKGNYHGRGKLLYFDDDSDWGGYRYEGEFVAGYPHGQGKWYRPDGTLEYEGEWQEDYFHGRGRSYHPDGTTIEYEGDWHESERHGQGTLYDRDGNIQRRGRWAHGNPIDDPTPSAGDDSSETDC